MRVTIEMDVPDEDNGFGPVLDISFARRQDTRSGFELGVLIGGAVSSIEDHVSGGWERVVQGMLEALERQIIRDEALGSAAAEAVGKCLSVLAQIYRKVPGKCQ
jgi:hypothetical protein